MTLTSFIAHAPELRTANLSATMPLKNALPEVAPYKQALPAITFSSEWKSEGKSLGGYKITSPPVRP